jgi:4,5-DOPA dioxygenase extradiol
MTESRLPTLSVALGAAGDGARGKVLHDSWYWGNLGLASYAFGE